LEVLLGELQRDLVARNAGLCQRVARGQLRVDHFLELLERLSSAERLAVDHEVRRAAHADLLADGEILVHLAHELLAVQGGLEFLAIHARCHGPLLVVLRR